MWEGTIVYCWLLPMQACPSAITQCCYSCLVETGIPLKSEPVSSQPVDRRRTPTPQLSSSCANLITLDFYNHLFSQFPDTDIMWTVAEPASDKNFPSFCIPSLKREGRLLHRHFQTSICKKLLLPTVDPIDGNYWWRDIDYHSPIYRTIIPRQTTPDPGKHILLPGTSNYLVLLGDLKHCYYLKPTDEWEKTFW